ncbi:MAG: ABC transporter permease, partial [Actinobacteria bacterium]|nr:ABC transporter permease [Actinomycetota bacterium]
RSRSGGIGLVMAGALKAELNLAAANGLYLVLLLLGGMVVPLGKLPGVLGTVSRLLPPAALSTALRSALSSTSDVSLHSFVVLAVWAFIAPCVAAVTFRWE